MRAIFTVLGVVLGLTFSMAAWASPSDSTLHALEGETVRITTTADQKHEGVLYAFDAERLTVVDEAGDVHELQRDAVEKVQLPRTTHAAESTDHTANAAEPADAQSPPASVKESGASMERDAQATARADFLREQRSLERTGSAYRISGGVITGVGALTAFSAMMSLAVSGSHWSTYGGEKLREDLRAGPVITAAVGTAITAAGVALIVVGNKKRRNVKAEYEKTFEYALSPQFSDKGAGAEMRLRF